MSTNRGREEELLRRVRMLESKVASLEEAGRTYQRVLDQHLSAMEGMGQALKSISGTLAEHQRHLIRLPGV